MEAAILCKKCNLKKPIIEFYRSAGKPKTSCKECHKKYVKDRLTASPEAKAKHREDCKSRYKNNKQYYTDRNLQYQFGISEIEYKKLLSDQSGKCAICGKAEGEIGRSDVKRLAVDHCHETGRIRGLLCAKCNRGLGNFLDNVDFLKSAIKYLESK